MTRIASSKATIVLSDRTTGVVSSEFNVVALIQRTCDLVEWDLIVVAGDEACDSAHAPAGRRQLNLYHAFTAGFHDQGIPD